LNSVHSVPGQSPFLTALQKQLLLAVLPMQCLLPRLHAAEPKWPARYSDRLRTELSGVRFPIRERNISILPNVQTGSEVQPSVQWAPQFSVDGKGGRSKKLTTHLHLVHKLRTSGAKHPVTLWKRKILLFYVEQLLVVERRTRIWQL